MNNSNTIGDQLAALGFTNTVESGTVGSLLKGSATIQGYHNRKGDQYIHIHVSEEALVAIGSPKRLRITMNGTKAIALVNVEDEHGTYSVYRHGGKGSKHWTMKIKADKLGFENVVHGVFPIPENHITYIADQAIVLSIPQELKG